MFTEEKESVMKRGVIAVVILSAVILAACTSTDLTTNKVGWSNYAEVAIKDYEAVGVINLESQEVYEATPFGINKSLKGSRIVWSDLMAEAVKMGANDVINIRIEVTDQNARRPQFVEFLTGYTLTYTYKATGLAIRYTTAIDRVKSSVGSELNPPSSGPQQEFLKEAKKSPLDLLFGR
jgi:hypothetical protein